MFFLFFRLVLLRFECFHRISLCYIELFFNYLSTLTNNLTSGKLFGSSLLICCFPAMITTITCRPLKVPRNQSNCIYIKGNIYVIIFNGIWIFRINDILIMRNFVAHSTIFSFYNRNLLWLYPTGLIEMHKTKNWKYANPCFKGNNL